MFPRLNSVGQSMTETLILLPFFLALVFGLVQIGQLGSAAIVGNYAASKIARKVVASDLGTTGAVDLNSYRGDLEKLLVAGMKDPDVQGCVQVEQPKIIRSVTVRTSTKVQAFPLFGDFLHAAFGSKFSGQASGCSDAANAMGPFTFSNTPPYTWTVYGKASARMNYRP